VSTDHADTEDLQALFDRMRHICEALEQDKSIKLEEAVKLHEEGVAIEKRIKAVLEEADRRVTELIQPDGSVEKFATTSTEAQRQRKA